MAILPVYGDKRSYERAILETAPTGQNLALDPESGCYPDGSFPPKAAETEMPGKLDCQDRSRIPAPDANGRDEELEDRAK